MAVNRYIGNSGRVERIPEREDAPRQEPFYRPRQVQPGMNARPPKPPREEKASPGIGSALQGKLGEMLIKFTELETEDIILYLVLYLLYRESGDEQYLIILGIMLFL